jgi:molybdenum-dependent DNA-binding transcriptional regulator ModE
MLGVELDKVEIFAIVARAGSIALASRQLGIVQPSVSRSIKILEEQLGVKLFHRHVRGLTLTPAGERFFAVVCLAFDQLQQAIGEVQDKDMPPRRNYTLLLAEWEKTVRLDVNDARQRRGIENAQILLESAVAETIQHVQGARQSLLGELAPA